jgi:glutamine amidotransferase
VEGGSLSEDGRGKRVANATHNTNSKQRKENTNMCLAIYKPASTKPDKEAYRNGFENNTHGAGFAAAVNGGLVIGKGFFKFKEFWRAFKPYADCPALIHFRLATHGKKDTDNCHPFSITDNLAMIHNGVLPICTKDDETKSDTWHFVEKILKPLHELDPEFYQHQAISFLGRCAISGSKFVFLRSDGDFGIWNEEDGKWESDGHWYSNSGYQPRLSVYSGRGSYNSAWDDDDFQYPRGLKPLRHEESLGNERESFPDWDPENPTIWGIGVSQENEWIADELQRRGFSRSSIEAGFQEDPAEMYDFLMDLLDEEDAESEARAIGMMNLTHE